MALATTANRNYPIVDDGPTSYMDTVIIPGLASFANMVDADIAAILTSVAGKINTSALDTDGTLAANSDAKIATQKATKTYADAVGAAAIAASQPLAARLTAIVATGITAAMFATDVVDTDATLAANSATRIPSQSAVKSYVDNAIMGVWWKPAVDVATTANITLSGEQTIDGVLTSASRVLVRAQTTQTENGIYLSAAGVWTRVADADTGFELWGATVMVKRGTVGANTQWTNTNATQPTLGSTSITFAQISGAGTYSATSGVILTGNQFSADTGTSGHKLPWLDGANTWGALQTFSADINVNNAAPIINLVEIGLATYSLMVDGQEFSVRPNGVYGNAFKLNLSGYATFAAGATFGATPVVGSDPIMTRGAAETVTGLKTFSAGAVSFGTGNGPKLYTYGDGANTGAASGLGTDMSTANYELSLFAGGNVDGVGRISFGSRRADTGAYTERAWLNLSTGAFTITQIRASSYVGSAALGSGVASAGGIYAIEASVDGTPYFQVRQNGNTYTLGGTVNSISLRSRKTAIKDAPYSFDDLLGFRLRQYEFRDKLLKGKKRLGLIVDEVEKILPEVMGLDDDGNPDSIDYAATALTVAITTMHEVKRLRAELNELRKAA